MTAPKPMPAPDGSPSLLPCPNPWCESHRYDDGGPKIPDDLWDLSGSNNLRVGCHYCDMKGPARSTEAEAIAAWNTRQAQEPADGWQPTEAMVERVAEAIWRAEWDSQEPAETWPALLAEDEDRADAYRTLARAALAALGDGQHG